MVHVEGGERGNGDENFTEGGLHSEIQQARAWKFRKGREKETRSRKWEDEPSERERGGKSHAGIPCGRRFGDEGVQMVERSGRGEKKRKKRLAKLGDREG